MEEFPNIQINPIGLDERVIAEVSRSVAAAVDATKDIDKSVAFNIEKRGHTYPGDKHRGWGLSGQGFSTHGFTGIVGQFGRGNGLLNNFSLQPFGIGTNTVLNNIRGGTSVFSGSGSSVALNKNTHIAQIKMAFAVEAYKGFGIIKNVIDLMCNFASEGLKIVHPRPAVQKFYERWAMSVDLSGRVKDMLRYYYKYGNVFMYTTMGTVTDISRKQMMSTRGNSNDPALEERQDFIEEQKAKPMGDRQIPWRYTLLNPFQMDIVGNKFFGESKWVFVLSQETLTEINNKTSRSAEHVDILDETDINLPTEFKNLPRTNDRVVQLDQDKLCVLQYMKDDHEDWADPMVWPVMNDVMYKSDLRAMDRSVINSTINAITIFKLGNIKDGFVAPPQHYKQFAQMLRTPTASHNIIWNDAITMESNYPPIEKILGVEKYRSVDKDILAGLGIPGILVNDEAGGNFSNAFLQVRTLLEKLEDGRTEVLKWINKQMRIIAEIMGHRDIPQVRFGQMSLRNEEEEKKLIIQLLDRNVISAERVHEVFGIETVIELERMRREKILSEEEDILIKHGPYTDPMNDLSQEEIKEMDFDQQREMMDMKVKQLNKQQKQNKPPRGRPGGSKGIPQKKKRETKPQGSGLGTLQFYSRIKKALSAEYSYIEDSLTDRMLQVRNVKYKKALSKKDREDLETLIFAVFSHVTEDNTIGDEQFIEDILQDIKINPSVDFYAKQIIRQMAGDLTAQDRRDVRVMALATYFYEGDINAS
jgi:hypothetical protein